MSRVVGGAAGPEATVGHSRGEKVEKAIKGSLSIVIVRKGLDMDKLVLVGSSQEEVGILLAFGRVPKDFVERGARPCWGSKSHEGNGHAQCEGEVVLIWALADM